MMIMNVMISWYLEDETVGLPSDELATGFDHMCRACIAEHVELGDMVTEICPSDKHYCCSCGKVVR